MNGEIVKQKEYEEGDVVLIRDWDDMEREYGMIKSGSCAGALNIDFIPEMRPYCNKMFIIEMKVSDCYILENPYKDLGNASGEQYYFTNEMIAGKVVVDMSPYKNIIERLNKCKDAIAKLELGTLEREMETFLH